MTPLRFEAGNSHLHIETRAKGMLAKLAHDLSIEASGFTASVALDAGRAVLSITAPVSGLRVRGVRRHGEVDTSVLSASDRNEIEGKIRREVLKGTNVEVRLEAPADEASLRAAHDVDVTGRVEVGGGSTRVSGRVSLGPSGEGLVAATGQIRLSLPSLGITPPKGPLGAFRVDDEVEIRARLVFAR